jgi:hypothetical protein
MRGKIKTEFSTSLILKKNLTKKILKKNMRKHCSKTKTMWGNIVTIHSVFFKKTTKQNQQIPF